MALEQQSFPDPWPEDSLAQEVEEPGTLVLIAAESYSTPPLGYAPYRAMGGEAELLLGRRPGYYGRGTDAVLYAGSTRPGRPPR